MMLRGFDMVEGGGGSGGHGVCVCVCTRDKGSAAQVTGIGRHWWYRHLSASVSWVEPLSANTVTCVCWISSISRT